MRTPLPRLRAHPRGRRAAVAVIVAVSFLVLLGFAALVLDIGYMHVVGAQLQASVDAASLAAASALDDDEATARARAVSLAGLNEAGGRDVALSNADVEFGDWDSDTHTFTGTAFAEASAVRVSYEVDDLSPWLSTIFGKEALAVRRSAISAPGLGGDAICGILADTYAKVIGNMTFDSWNSSLGTYTATRTDTSAICSNTDLDCNGSATVDGSLYAGPSGTLSNSCDVSGEAGHLAERIPMPTVDCTSAKASNNNASVKKFMTGYNFRANAKDVVTLAAGTYYFNDMTVNAKATVNISPNVVICVEGGTVTLNGDSFVNTSKKPTSFTLEVADTSKVTLNGTSTFYGSVIAPKSPDVKLNGTFDFYGVVVGDQITANGTLKFHADEALLEPYTGRSSSGSAMLVY